MNIKTHIAFIALIILVVFLIWKMVQVAPEEKPPLVISGYAIEVVRASYGLECNSSLKYRPSTVTDPYAGQDNTRNLIRENNVLTPISSRCNGQVRCNVKAEPLDFGKDIANCAGATLQVEYRCFMLDRLRRSIASSGEMVVIDCSNIN